MNQPSNERLAFLSRVIEKERAHLAFSTAKLNAIKFSVETAKALNNDPELAEAVEAFASRFARYQDTLGDKLLPAWLQTVAEKSGTTIDNLDRAEKLDMLDSVDSWITLRQLRNQMVHEYTESPETLSDAINAALDGVDLLNTFADNLLGDLQTRKII